MALSTRSLARSSSRHPWRTVGLWVLAMMVAGALIGSLKEDALTQEVGLTNNPEAKQAADLIEERLRGPERDTEIVIVSSQGATVDDPAFEAYVTRLSDALRGLGPDVVLATQTYYESQDQNLVSRDRHITLVPTVLAGPIQDAVDHVPELKEAIAQNRAEGFTVNLSGAAALGDDFNTVSAEDLRTGESIGVMAALIILVVVFGAVVAATLPILVGIAAIAVGLGIVVALGQITQFSFFVENMITMMGLAVGIDYSLFVVSRYREERRRGRDKLDAIEAAGATASRAVLFSGMTVVLALLGMLMIPNTIFRSLASGAIFAVVAAVLASMTLLPALLGLLGDRINRLRIHRRDREPAPVGGFWDKVTHGVMARPVLSLVAGVGVLLFLGSFWAVMHTGFSGVSTVPDGLPSKEGFEILGREFSGGLSSPVEIAIDGRADDPAVQAGVQRLRDSLAADGMFGPTRVEVNEARDLTLVSAPLNGDPDSRAATDSIGRIRSEYVPHAFPEGTAADVLVGGRTAFNKDFFDISHIYMPIVFVFVLGLSFILLTVAFRSLVVPLKAILLNLLSVAAAYGLITLVFQEGVGADLLGFQQVEVIEAWLPLFLFSVLFGLSMDYHVFLLSRIREHYDKTGDNTGSVAYGLRTTAGIITGAALIMVAVFGGFASGRMAAFQQMGFSLAAAVLIDATLIRSVLVPASMELLGNRNWYLPHWLEWLPKVTVDGDVEATKDERAAEPVGAGRR